MLDGLSSSTTTNTSGAGLMDPFGGGGGGMANLSLGSSNTASGLGGGVTGLGAMRTLLRAEMGGGLKITYQCQRGLGSGGASSKATGVAVTFTNTKDEPLKQV